MTSHSPDDEREGYCGRCHDWTGVSEAPVPDFRIVRPWAASGDYREILVPSGSARIAALGAVFLSEPGAALNAGLAAARRLGEQVMSGQRTRRLRELLGEEPGPDAARWTPAD